MKKKSNKLLRIWYTFTQLWAYYNCNKDVRKQTIRNDRRRGRRKRRRRIIVEKTVYRGTVSTAHKNKEEKNFVCVPSNWKLEQPTISFYIHIAMPSTTTVNFFECACEWMNEWMCMCLGVCEWVCSSARLSAFACIAATHVGDDKFEVNFFIMLNILWIYLCLCINFCA